MPSEDEGLAGPLQTIRRGQIAAAAVLLFGAAASGLGLAWFRVGDLMAGPWVIIVVGAVVGPLLATMAGRSRGAPLDAMRGHVTLWWVLATSPAIMAVVASIGLMIHFQPWAMR